MVTGDASYIKRINRSLIISEIVKHRMISRADLSKAINLTRATISAQVADLLEEGLIIETQLEHNAVGRKPIMLSINGQAGYALGIDLDYGQISFTLSDLLGIPVTSAAIELNTTDYSEILALLIKQINQYKAEFSESRYGIIGVAVAIHGLVGKDETIHFVPRFKWKDIQLKNDLENEIDLNVFVENNANLSAYAERVFFHHDTENLLCATLYSGIGLGMMINNQPFKGHDGFAGEIGHMIVVPEGKQCSCGNKGCWELYSSESSLFSYLTEKKQVSHLTYKQIQQWLDDGDQEVAELMKQALYYLSIGLNNLINIYNPEVLVLDSELLRMNPASLEIVKNHLHSSVSHYRKLAISSIGKESSILGACALAIKHFLDVPILNLAHERE
ncbi:ROK family transcriptional regulator [Cytobacillus oceanisediminis]|uniref:ROK family transcriptional regulator n=1 Tax=Cytobacillus oceanisediminis TaxID=665099 RepID=UPI0037357BE1